METTIAVPNALSHSPAHSKGRAIGALICGFFGAFWMFQALFLGSAASPLWLTLTALIAAILVLWPAAELFRSRSAPYSCVQGVTWSSVSIPYWTVVVIEFVACTVGGNWLNYVHRSDLSPQLIGLIVGVHFFPLAKIFRAPIYYWTGAAMLAGVAASVAFPAGAVRNLTACGLCGLALWATELEILVSR